MKKLFTLLIAVFFTGAFLFAQQKIEGVAAFVKTGYMYAPASGKTFNQVAPASIRGFDDNYFLFGAEVCY